MNIFEKKTTQWWHIQIFLFNSEISIIYNLRLLSHNLCLDFQLEFLRPYY